MEAMKFQIEKLKFDERGLIPAIVQDAKTREILTLAYMNQDSLRQTLETGQTWFWSRSRNELWHKGSTSGNTQQVVDLILDCDGDALVVMVNPAGPACHTGERSCFRSGESECGSDFERATNLGELLEGLYQLIETRQRSRPEGSYTTYLFDQGLDKILKKVGEESAETIIAAKNEDRSALVYESSDLIYHLLVLLVARGIGLNEIKLELDRRRSSSEES